MKRKSSSAELVPSQKRKNSSSELAPVQKRRLSAVAADATPNEPPRVIIFPEKLKPIPPSAPSASHHDVQHSDVKLTSAPLQTVASARLAESGSCGSGCVHRSRSGSSSSGSSDNASIIGDRSKSDGNVLVTKHRSSSRSKSGGSSSVSGDSSSGGSSSNGTSGSSRSEISNDKSKSSSQNSSNSARSHPTTSSGKSSWKKLKGKAKQVAATPLTPTPTTGQGAGPVFRTRIVDVGSKLLALSALGDAGGDYKLGGERLRLIAEVVPSMSLPSVIYLDNPLQTSITFGRGTEANIKIDSTRHPYYISRKHATIRRDPNFKYTLIDEDSKTGCFVNDVRVKKAVLNFGDVIRFGGPECNFGDIRVQPTSEFIYVFEKVKKHHTAGAQEEDEEPVYMRSIDRIRQIRERVATVFELGVICLVLPLSYLNPTVKEWTAPLFSVVGIEPPPFYVVLLALGAILALLFISTRRSP